MDPDFDLDDDQVLPDVEESRPWRPAEPKPFYWLVEVAKFIGVSRGNALLKIRQRRLRAKMFRRGGRCGWIVTHNEMVRYMEEGASRRYILPAVERQVEPAGQAREELLIPDPVPRPRIRTGAGHGAQVDPVGKP